MFQTRITGKLQRLAMLALMLCLAAGCRGRMPLDGTTKAQVIFDANDRTQTFAAEELMRFLSGQGGLNLFKADKPVGRSGWCFKLVVDSRMEPYTFRVSSNQAGDGSGRWVELAGPDSTCALHAVYTLLERAGYQFESTGPVRPSRIDLEALRGWSTVVRPAVQQRGIRLHMNFPQDLSSYTLAEAKEYIHNLARLRINQMTFHSYPGRLHTAAYDGKKMYAGIMYDDPLEISDDPIFRKVVRNERFFRCPELEQYMKLESARAVRPQEWMAAVFAEVKRTGMHLRFSFEPRLQGMDHTANAFADIIAAYPMIDSLELTTNENGGGGEPDAAGMRQVLEECFDVKALDDPILKPLLAQPPASLVTLFREIGYNLKAANFLSTTRNEARHLPMHIGVYCIPEDYSKAAARLLHLYAPKDYGLAFMPQYGSRWVAKRFAQMALSTEDWQRTTAYGWLEFDGMFFFQQNDVAGVRDLIALAGEKAAGQPVHAISFNVWRNAENRAVTRYAAQAMVVGAIKPHAFFEQYASRLGIGDVPAYLQAMDEIDAAVELARDTWNIGFSWPWMWVGWWNSNLTGWDQVKLKAVQSLFENANRKLAQVLQATSDPTGRERVAFVKNRVECSILHLQATRQLYRLLPILVDGKREPVPPKSLSDDQRRQVMEVCHDATYLANKYMGTHAAMTPDRGSEGALMIYNYCLPELIRKLQAEYGGDKNVKALTIQETDTWPKPSALQ